MMFEFVVHGKDGSQTDLKVDIASLVIAGWAGRDPAAIEHHIEELEAIGVPRPSQVPLFYRVASQLLSQSAEIEVLGDKCSGEVEVLLFAHGGQIYMTLTSDHTDRGLETVSVAHSKQVCPKPIGRHAWRLKDVLNHWDQLLIESSIQDSGREVVYQHGALAALLPPQALLQKFFASTDMPDGWAMSCGTVATKGTIRSSPAFHMALIDPVLGREIRHAYDVNVLPVVA